MLSREEELIEIDGSHGEGGGQILRTALACSAILKKPIAIQRIRAMRKKPGLQPQHLMAIKALSQLTSAETKGIKIGSDSITFIPQTIQPGEYQFDIGTAGSITLLLQAFLAPVCLSRGKSQFILIGGTHVPWSPPFHYLSEVLYPTLASMGISVEVSLERWGWYPKGGGIARVEIKPTSEIKPINLCDRGPLKRIRGLSAISDLPHHVGDRQRDYAMRKIEKEMRMDAEIDVLHDVPGNGPGSFFFLVAESEKAIAGFSALGRKGKPAEEVSREAVDSLKNYLVSDGCIDPYLADQLVLFMALAKGNSSFTTHRMTSHLLTNLWTIQHFINVKISKQDKEGKAGKIELIAMNRNA